MPEIKKVIGVIGGSGFYEFPELERTRLTSVATPYGDVSQITVGEYQNTQIIFMPRHGADHSVPPHKVNYRANIDALTQLGVTHIIAVNATGGISETCKPETFVIPDQVIDYTYGREHTFYDGSVGLGVDHIDFTQPFDFSMTKILEASCQSLSLDVVAGGVYGCTQGPRLESAAEISKMHKDGCDLVGMTLMPELSLAREKKLCYVSLCFIVNWCAGIRDEVISINKIMARLDSNVPKIREAILKTIDSL